MPHNVTAAGTAWKKSHGEATTWHTMQGAETLEHRWREVGLKLTAAGGSIVVPCSEVSVIQMQAELARLTASAPEPRVDPMLEREVSKFRDAAQQYRELYNRLEKHKKQSADPQKAIVLRILGIGEVTLPEGPQQLIERLFGRQHPPNHPGQLMLPRADSAEAAVYATRLIGDATVPLERQLDQLRVVDDFESQEHYPNSQLRLLIEAAFRQFEFQQTTVRNLMLKTQLLEEKLAAFERKPVTKRKHRSRK